MKVDLQNPFHPQFGKRPDKFVGRDQIIQGYLDSLKDKNDPIRVTVAYGIRGSGKTALLSGIKESISSQKFAVVDVTAEASLLQSIIDQLWLNAKKSNRKLTGINVGAFGFNIGLSTSLTESSHGFRYHLTLAVEEFNKRGIVVVFLIDEVHRADSEMREFVTSYQHLVRDNADVALFMAGLPSSVHAVLNDKLLTFLHRAYKLPLLNVNTLLVNNLYQTTFAEGGFEADSDIIKTAADATFGFPYLIQLIGYWLWKEADSKFTSVDINNALINSKAALFDNVYALMLREVSEKDRAFLLAMHGDSGTTKFGDILTRLDVSSSYASKYRQRLIEGGLIMEHGHGYLRYAPPYFGEFLTQAI
jgi:hypothetical protein